MGKEGCEASSITAFVSLKSRLIESSHLLSFMSFSLIQVLLPFISLFFISWLLYLISFSLFYLTASSLFLIFLSYPLSKCFSLIKVSLFAYLFAAVLAL